ncbi:MAG: putative membrane protein YeaQ/YmgE (transglycosylase-associated protein family) [Maribacter sp.]|jgi:uncharacterized membrane protein YeaQ/YmgE (transglycosylase-associated protein family)
MEYVYLALLGLTAGSLAKFILPGKDRFGLIMTIIIGVGGSYIGAYAAQYIPQLGNPPFGSMTWQGVVSAIIGSVILLLIARILFGGRK